MERPFHRQSSLRVGPVRQQDFTQCRQRVAMLGLAAFDRGQVAR
jgi:hypothetical protein